MKRGYFGEAATLARVRAACPDESPVDVDRHARHVAEIVVAARGRDRDAMRRRRVARELHARLWR